MLAGTQSKKNLSNWTLPTPRHLEHKINSMETCRLTLEIVLLLPFTLSVHRHHEFPFHRHTVEFFSENSETISSIDRIISIVMVSKKNIYIF